MATSAERIRVLRERQRTGFRRLTIDVSDDDLRAIAKRGYEGAVTSDRINRPKLSPCSSRTRFCKSDRLDPAFRRQTWRRYVAQGCNLTTSLALSNA